ncbi:hypothetical protein O988_05635 [Pseudogymnoascus sp. VKM F-3808]|nr:hypothetical protein O988_05635 [Pseudogymnoascus sp. VKM F-3808]
MPTWSGVFLCTLAALIVRAAGPPHHKDLLSIARTRNGRQAILILGLPVMLLVEAAKLLLGLLPDRITVTTSGIDASIFADEKEFQRILTRLGNAGARTTGSKAHNSFISWIEEEFEGIGGLSIRSDEYDILRWQTMGGASLKEAGRLTLSTGGRERIIGIAGVVPFSMPTPGRSGELIYLASGVQITEAAVKGKVILRDFPAHPIPYSMIFLPSYSKTGDLNRDLVGSYDRPGLADMPLKDELIAAGVAGAAGMIIMFDVESRFVDSYFEPHQGVHYRLPAMFVGADEASLLKAAAACSAIATLSVDGEVAMVPTRNVFATLPGQTSEKIIFQSHTDGNTFVQENGVAAILTLAQHYAKQPLSSRRRTIEFALTTGHLHISREGTVRHAEELNLNYEKDNNLVLLVPVEHLGTREIEAVPRSNGLPGRELRFSGRSEMMFWCVGPAPAVVKAVQQAVQRRNLDRVLITRGTSMPNFNQVPTYSSFGGIGTYYHNLLLPTTSLISGPWSLWAPWFGSEAIDLTRLREQTLAVGDIYMALENVDREAIAGGYLKYRRRRANGAKVPASLVPSEVI